MKRISILFYLLLSGMLYAQLDPNVISFEHGSFGGLSHSPTEGHNVSNSYFSQAYGVTFHMGAINSGILPKIAEVGHQDHLPYYYNGYGFVGPAGNIYSSSQGNGCVVAASETRDKPDGMLDVGCYFLTDNVPGPDTMPLDLLVSYEDISCSVVSGYLLDVDGHLPNGNQPTWQEGWKITCTAVNPSAQQQVIYLYSPYYSQYNSNPVGTSYSATGDGVASYWKFDLGNEIVKEIKFEYIGSSSAYVGLAFDEFFLCSDAEPDTTGCCDGTNLFPNGTFEDGNTGFVSGYTNQSSFSANSIIPGQYGIGTSLQALAVSPQWDALNHTNCSNKGKFMMVNGRTMTNSSTSVYQQTNIAVDPDKEYTLCYYYKPLPQCAFEVWDDANLTPVVSGASITANTCDDDTTGLCGWKKASYTLTPSGNSINFYLYLSQGGVGDGNDFALDDISLKEKQVMPVAYSKFTNNPTAVTTFYRSYNATADFSPLPAGFDVTWRAVEVDCDTEQEIPGTSMTWTSDPYETSYPGYCCNSGSTSPGKFYENKCYNVYRTVTNCCFLDGVYFHEFRYGQAARMAGPGGAEAGYGEYVSSDGVNWTPVEGTELAWKGDSHSPVNIQLFPNPGNGNLSLRSSNSLAGMKISVSDIKGKVLFTRQIEEERNEIEMDLTELPSGMYLIQLQSEDGSVRQEKYVKQ